MWRGHALANSEETSDNRLPMLCEANARSMTFRHTSHGDAIKRFSMSNHHFYNGERLQMPLLSRVCTLQPRGKNLSFSMTLRPKRDPSIRLAIRADSENDGAITQVRGHVSTLAHRNRTAKSRPRPNHPASLFVHDPAASARRVARKTFHQQTQPEYL